jgi:hypothetical protein
MCVNGAVWCKSPDGPRPWCLKCERDRPLPAIGKIKLPVTFGKQWRYGTGVCPLCGRAHSKNQTLLESGGSKAFVEVLLANLVRVGFKDNCMVGALVPQSPGSKVLIAYSGVGGRPLFESAARGMSNTIVCPEVRKENVQSRGGMKIPVEVIEECKVKNEPLQCAAPKMIDYANRHGYPLPYNMTEVMFNPSTHARFFGEHKGFTVHGQTIESCKTCESIVPLLLCTETIFTSTS